MDVFVGHFESMDAFVTAVSQRKWDLCKRLVVTFAPQLLYITARFATPGPSGFWDKLDAQYKAVEDGSFTSSVFAASGAFVEALNGNPVEAALSMASSVMRERTSLGLFLKDSRINKAIENELLNINWEAGAWDGCRVDALLWYQRSLCRSCSKTTLNGNLEAGAPQRWGVPQTEHVSLCASFGWS